jgi:hypothetical protein
MGELEKSEREEEKIKCHSPFACMCYIGMAGKRRGDEKKGLLQLLSVGEKGQQGSSSQGPG